MDKHNSSKNNSKSSTYWSDKLKSYTNTNAKNKLKALKDAEKAQKDAEKLKEQNASAAEKMRMNWQQYKDQSIKAFAGNSSSNLLTPGQSLPSFPEKPKADFQPGQKIASTLTLTGSKHIERMIKHATQMRKLKNLIKYIEYEF